MTGWPILMTKKTVLAYLDMGEVALERVIALLEAGCTIPEVQSVTGQSVEMVMHYAARVDQGKLSEAAILKLERRK